MALSPSERSQRAKLAAHTLHSKVDTLEHTRPGREAFMARFEKEVDPDNSLPAAERQRRAAQAKKAYFTRLSFESAKARRQA